MSNPELNAEVTATTKTIKRQKSAKNTIRVKQDSEETVASGKSLVREEITDAYVDSCNMAEVIQSLKRDLHIMKQNSVKCKDIEHLLKSVAELIELQQKQQQLKEKPIERESCKAPAPPLPYSPAASRPSSPIQSRPSSPVNKALAPCSSIVSRPSSPPLFQVPPPMFILSENEFSKIPKYVIGRFTREAVNNLVTNLNQIYQTKYSILSQGKERAKNRGEFNQYLSYIKEISSLTRDEKQTYYFTPDDYERYMKAKLDKSTLNLIVALRYCKRLREFRIGQTVYYALIIPSEAKKDS